MNAASMNIRDIADKRSLLYKTKSTRKYLYKSLLVHFCQYILGDLLPLESKVIS